MGVVLKLNEGDHTLQLSLMVSDQKKEVSQKCWLLMVEKGLEEEGKSSIVEKDTEKSLNSSWNANFRAAKKSDNLCFHQG